MRTLAILLALAAAAHAQKPVRVPEAVDLKNKKDPVNGKKAAEAVTADWHGVRVRFFDAESAAKFKKAPEKYVKRLGLKVVGKVLSLENKKCPVTGGEVKTFLDRAGVRIHVASAEAAKALAKDPAKYHGKLGYGYVPSVIDLRNETCPVTSDPCYPEAPIWAEHDGIRVRLCCDHCIKEFRSDPKRCFQALMVDPEKLKRRIR